MCVCRATRLPDTCLFGLEKKKGGLDLTDEFPHMSCFVMICQNRPLFIFEIQPRDEWNPENLDLDPTFVIPSCASSFPASVASICRISACFLTLKIMQDWLIAEDVCCVGQSAFNAPLIYQVLQIYWESWWWCSVGLFSVRWMDFFGWLSADDYCHCCAAVMKINQAVKCWSIWGCGQHAVDGLECSKWKLFLLGQG